MLPLVILMNFLTLFLALTSRSLDCITIAIRLFFLNHLFKNLYIRTTLALKLNYC